LEVGGKGRRGGLVGRKEEIVGGVVGGGGWERVKCEGSWLERLYMVCYYVYAERKNQVVMRAKRARNKHKQS
jgi:hypothetical protein